MADENHSNPAANSPSESSDPTTDPAAVESRESDALETVAISRDPLSKAEWIAGLCFFFSGFLALVYEICWIRKASLVFGNTTYAISTVVAVFFGGLALGSYLFGRLTKRNLTPMKTYAKLEIWIGILAALTPVMFKLVEGPFGLVYDSILDNFAHIDPYLLIHTKGGKPVGILLTSGLRMLLITVCILPTTILIGGTLPLFCRQFVRQSPQVARPVGWLYGINTLGAACGCACCGFLMIPILGTHYSIYLAATLNLVIGLVAWKLTLPAITPYVEPVPEVEDEETVEDDKETDEATDEEQSSRISAAGDQTPAVSAKQEKTVSAELDDEQPPDEDNMDEDGELEEDEEEEYYEDEPWELSNPSRVMAILFFMSGFTALANEVLWTRFLSLILHNTVYTYTLTLTVILLGIVLGSILTAARFDRVQRHGFLFGCVLTANSILVLVAMLLPASFWTRWADSQQLSEQFLLIAAIMLLPSILSGMTFPLAIRFVVKEASHAGINVGRMVALNTLGGILGSLLVGFVFLPHFGMALTLKWTTGLGLLAGMSAWILLDSSTLRLWLVIASAACWMTISNANSIPFIGANSALIGFPANLPEDYLGLSGALLDHSEGTGSTVSVTRNAETITLQVDRLWQGTNERTHQALAAHIPAILHEQPEEVLVIGLGPGQTARRFLMHDVKKLDCVEIEKKLVELLVQSPSTQGFNASWLLIPEWYSKGKAEIKNMLEAEKITSQQADERLEALMKKLPVSVIYDDGRNYITHTKNKYDIIAIEIGQVFRPGLGSFYTREFYQAAKPRLKKNGILCQFVPLKFLTKEEFRSLVGTFVDVFPNSVLWYNTSELLLLGTPGEPIKLSPARLRRIEQNPRLHDDLAYAYWGGPDHYLNQGHVFLGGFLANGKKLKALSKGAPLQHDNRPQLEYMRNIDLPAREFHKPIVKLIQENLAPISEILSEALPDRTILAGNMVRDENLRSIVSAAYLETGSNLLAKSVVLVAQGNFPAAQAENLAAQHHLLRAVNFLPAYAEASYFLGDTHRQRNNSLDSIGYYRQAIRIRPDYVRARTQLADTLRDIGEIEAAISHFDHVLQLTPQMTNEERNLMIERATGISASRALIGLSKIRATHQDAGVRNAIEALKLAQRAYENSQQRGGSDSEVWITLADANAANGRFEEAKKCAARAAQRARSALDIEKIRERMAFYNQKRPYIEQVTRNVRQPRNPELNPGPNQAPPQQESENINPAPKSPNGTDPTNP